MKYQLLLYNLFVWNSKSLRTTWWNATVWPLGDWRCMRGEMPLFGLSEIGGAFFTNPRNPNLEATVSSHSVKYVQLYTSIVKPMDQRQPLTERPHLLTHLLGQGYVRNAKKFKTIWKEVESKRTKLKIMEVWQCEPTIPLEARFEMVLTEDNPSFLSHIQHRTLTRVFCVDRLFVWVLRKSS